MYVFWQKLSFLLSPILTKMQVWVMLYTYWTPCLVVRVLGTVD